MRWRGAALVLCLSSCSVDETTQVEDTGGTGGGSASGGTGALGGGTFGGTGGTGATGGSGGNVGGSAGTPTGGAAGTPAGGAGGAGGTGGVAGTTSGGGTGGVVDPCAGKCTDGNAICSGSGSCDCNANFVNVDTDGDAQTADCKSTIVTKVTAEIAIGHTQCGNLVIKLRGPDNTLITLMSRPGANEAADDGAGAGGGDMSDMVSSSPVTFDDAAVASAESMGSGPPGQSVCQQSLVCDYHPDHGAATGPTTLSAAFDGKSATGTWRMCVGDADNNDTGTFHSWELRVTTSNHQFTKSADGLNLAIPDGGYNGSLDPASAACADITLP